MLFYLSVSYTFNRIKGQPHAWHDYIRQTRRGPDAVQSNSLARTLRYCRDNICECLSRFMQAQDGGGSGLDERFDRMMGPNAVQSGRPTHIDQINGRQGAMREAMALYDQFCRGPNAPQHAPIPQRALENMNRPIPTIEDWEAEHGGPQPEGNYEPGQGSNFDATEYADEAAAGVTIAGVAYVLWQLARVYPPRNLVPF